MQDIKNIENKIKYDKLSSILFSNKILKKYLKDIELDICIYKKDLNEFFSLKESYLYLGKKGKTLYFISCFSDEENLVLFKRFYILEKYEIKNENICYSEFGCCNLKTGLIIVQKFEKPTILYKTDIKIEGNIINEIDQ